MKQSAGILVFKRTGELQIFLVHPGGPYFKNKNAGAWSIPKGEYTDEEIAMDAAKREFLEETGFAIVGELIPLKAIKQKGGKTVNAWAVEQDVDADNINSNRFEIQWPPRSGKLVSFPEVDKAAWFSVDDAKEKINPAQASFIDELISLL